MRAELSRLLVLQPEMLLLDEPTNHLDLPAIIWLEKFLHSTKSTIILVSHDVEFLNKNTSRIFDISQKSIKDFSGNYSQYIIFREKEIERQIKEKKNQNKYIKQTNLLIEKFRYKKNKASFAQTLIKRLNKMEEIEIDEFDVSSIRFQFPEPLHCGKIIFQAKLLKKAFGENVVFEDFDLDIYRSDRIAFVGKNGCGKTTLTRIINGDLECEGYYKIGEKVIINYFAQNQNERLDSNMSIIEYVESIAQDKSVSQLRGILGSFLFSGDSVYKKIKVLSGGEKARLSLCASLLTPSNMIILDEPTNHLDIFAKDILKEALLQYNGTLIVVSHDRKFLTGLTDRVIEFSDNKIREYPGDINSYLDNQEFELDVPIKKKTKNNNSYLQKKEIAKYLRSLKKQSTVIETEITKIEDEIETFYKLLSNANNNNLDKPINYNDYNKLNEMLNNKLDKWEEIQAKINQLDKSQ